MYAEKIRVVLIKRKMKISELASALGCTPSNITNKLRRDNFSESELLEICKALNCTLSTKLIMNDTKEEV